MKVVAIANSAGGVGKTTLAHCLAVSFAEFGKKTLLIDLDPAGSITFRLGYENARISLADFFNGIKLNDSNTETTSERFDFIPTDSRLTSIFSADALSLLLSDLPKEYEIVLLDLPPSLSQPFALALPVTDLLLVPVRNNLHSLRGYLQVKSAAADIAISAVAIGPNTFISNTDLLDESIVASPEIESAAAAKVSILTSDKSGALAESYRSVGYSILEKLGLE
ncbi:Soj ATPases involved in chromosome partitioning [Candidatus Nanopelagicaceae bacterium]